MWCERRDDGEQGLACRRLADARDGGVGDDVGGVVGWLGAVLDDAALAIAHLVVEVLALVGVDDVELRPARRVVALGAETAIAVEVLAHVRGVIPGRLQLRGDADRGVQLLPVVAVGAAVVGMLAGEQVGAGRPAQRDLGVEIGEVDATRDDELVEVGHVRRRPQPSVVGIGVIEHDHDDVRPRRVGQPGIVCAHGGPRRSPAEDRSERQRAGAADESIHMAKSSACPTMPSRVAHRPWRRSRGAGACPPYARFGLPSGRVQRTCNLAHPCPRADQALRRLHRCRCGRLRCLARPGLRLPRTQRRRQDQHHAHGRLHLTGDRGDAARPGPGPGQRRLGHPGTPRRGAPGRHAGHGADGPREPHHLRALLRSALRRVPPSCR